MITIEKIETGYLVQDGIFKRSYPNVQELFENLLLVLEGRSEGFGGDAYGKVRVEKKP